jgi:hypothetical protein
MGKTTGLNSKLFMNRMDEILLPDTKPEVLQQVRLQIEKDLSLCNFKYSIISINNLPQMVPELQNKIEELKQNKSSDIMKIVNRVDLTERQYQRLSAMPGDWTENFAKAIVLREFQKVIIRNKFNK